MTYMHCITVDSFMDNESLFTYELPQGSSILDLKAEIEDTEGIPVGCQGLLYNENVLRDSEKLDSITETVFLVQNLFSVRLEPQGRDRLSEVITVPPDSNRRIQDLFEEPGIKGIADPSKSTVYLYDSDGVPIPIDDTNKSFKSYEIEHLDTVLIRSEPLQTFSPCEIFEVKHISGSFERFETQLQSLRVETYTPLRAKYDWNGDLNHPGVTGLPLERGAILLCESMPEPLQPGWLYGSLDQEDNDNVISQEPKHGLLQYIWLDRQKVGYFPENYVCPIDDSAEAKDDELEKPPKLPTFLFPALIGETYRVNVGDRGHSYAEFSVQYERLSRPFDPARITVKLEFSTHGSRRISAFDTFIKIPGNTISDVRISENDAHNREIGADVKMTTSQSTQAHFDGLQVGAVGAQVEIDAGISKNSGIDKVETGHITDKITVEARLTKEGSCPSIHWNLKAPQIGFDTKGLYHEESISFTLARKPAEFRYKRAVTHGLVGKIAKTVYKNSRGY